MKVCVLLLSTLYLMASKIFYLKYAEVLRRSWRKKMLLSRKKVAHLHKAREENIRKFVVISSFFFCLSFYVAEMEKLLHAFNSKVFMANYFIYEDYHKHTKKSIFALKCKATSLPKKFILLTAS